MRPDVPHRLWPVWTRERFQEKGYYIVLFLCILAVGISGYIFIKSAVSEKNSLSEETLSVATTTTIPQSGQTASPPASAAEKQDAPASAEAPSAQEYRQERRRLNMLRKFFVYARNTAPDSSAGYGFG
mgnify:CR=1 FL=1